MPKTGENLGATSSISNSAIWSTGVPPPKRSARNSFQAAAEQKSEYGSDRIGFSELQTISKCHLQHFFSAASSSKYVDSPNQIGTVVPMVPRSHVTGNVGSS